MKHPDTVASWREPRVGHFFCPLPEGPIRRALLPAPSKHGHLR